MYRRKIRFEIFSSKNSGCDIFPFIFFIIKFFFLFFFQLNYPPEFLTSIRFSRVFVHINEMQHPEWNAIAHPRIREEVENLFLSSFFRTISDVSFVRRPIDRSLSSRFFPLFTKEKKEREKKGKTHLK